MTKILVLILALVVCLTSANLVFAVPITTTNDRPTDIGVAPSTEVGLQTLVNRVFGSDVVDVDNDQQKAGVWSSSTLFLPSLAPRIMFEYAGFRNTNVFGIWSGTDTDSITTLDIFSGAMGQGASALLEWDVTNTFLDVRIGSTQLVNDFRGIDPFSFGFYLKRGDGVSFYTIDALNPYKEAHALAFRRPNSDTWLLAFEDLLLREGADMDYNDMVVKVESIIPTAVPEPGTLALLGTGLLGLGGIGLYRRRRN